MPADGESLRCISRRQVAKREFQFSDDRGHVLGTTYRARATLHGLTTTAAGGSFRSMGTGLNHRLVNVSTNEVTLGKGIGWRLPDGRTLSMKVSRGRPRNRVCEFKDDDGAVVLHLRWVPPAAPWRGHCPVAIAELGTGLEPTDDLVPLLAYAFQWFGYACQYKGGG